MESQCGPRSAGETADRVGREGPVDGECRTDREGREAREGHEVVDAPEPRDGRVDPAEHDVRWVYQPVEVDLGDGSWALGRISGWWQDAAGRRWCRLRVGRSGRPACWERFDPARVLLLPVSGM